LIVPDQRGLRGLHPSSGENARFAGNHPGIEQEEVDRSTSLGQLGEGGLHVRLLFQLQLQGGEYLPPGLGCEMSGGFLHPSEAAPSDDDFGVAVDGEQTGRRKSEAGGGTGDEGDRMLLSGSHRGCRIRSIYMYS